MEIKGILFDKDGTLIDFYEVWGKAVKPVIEQVVKSYGFVKDPGLVEMILKKIGVDGDVIDPEGSFAWKTYDEIAQDIVDAIEAEKKIRYSAPKVKNQLSQLFFEKIAVEREEYPVFTDLKKMMEQLHAMQIRTGIATTDEYEASVECMKKTGIYDQISFYGTAGSQMPVKPNKELINEAARQWNIRPEEIAVVGDTPNDMRFARMADSIAIGVLSGTGKKKDLELSADYIINSVDELIGLIKHVNQRS